MDEIEVSFTVEEDTAEQVIDSITQALEDDEDWVFEGTFDQEAAADLREQIEAQLDTQ